MITGKTIFIAALDWGLGHATRCVPLIRSLQANNAIYIGITPETRWIFENEFPALPKIDIPPYDIRYAPRIPVWLHMLTRIPSFARTMRSEFAMLDELMSQYKFDVIISDSRYGLHHPAARSILVTHQLFIKSPVLNRLLQKQNRRMICRFDEVWVPDRADQPLSGTLSSGKAFHPHVSWIGPLSRLPHVPEQEHEFEFAVILSGPQPQLSMLESKLFDLASRSGKHTAFITRNQRLAGTGRIEVFHDADAQTIASVIARSATVITRSGYSTLMDMHHLKKKALVLIPTPGQTEQEYLAEYWKETFGARVCRQKHAAAIFAAGD